MEERKSLAGAAKESSKNQSLALLQRGLPTRSKRRLLEERASIKKGKGPLYPWLQVEPWMRFERRGEKKNEAATRG